MKDHTKTPPIPSLVLSLGAFAQQITASVRSIYLRGDLRRRSVTRFITANLEEQGVVIKEAEETFDLAREQIVNGDGGSRKETFHQTIQSLQEVHTQLEEILHSLYTHENLIATGWETTYDIPINVYLIADITDHVSAGMVFPFLVYLEQMLAETRISSLNLLLNVAAGPEFIVDYTSDVDVQVVTFLKELDQILALDSPLCHELNHLVGFEGEWIDLPQIYLFDQYKEGSYLVKDRDELRVMIGNALLALLQNDLARQLVQYHNEHEIYESGSFYHSLGAASLHYDPQSLVQYCVEKSASEFIDRYILEYAVDYTRASKQVDDFFSHLGGFDEWAEHFMSQLPQETGIRPIRSQIPAMTVSWGAYQRSPIAYQDFTQLPWKQELLQTHESFNENIFPQAKLNFERSAKKWEDEVSVVIETQIDALLVDLKAYPGGLQTAVFVLEAVEKRIGALEQELENLNGKLEAERSQRIKSFEGNLDRVQTFIEQAPVLPKWMRIVPKAFQGRVFPAWYAYKYRHGIQNLKVYTQRAEEDLWRIAGIHLLQAMFTYFKNGIGVWLDLIRQGQDDYHALFDVWHTYAKELDQPTTFPLGQAQNDWHPLFRKSVVDLQFAQWAYKKWHPDFDGWVLDLVVESGLFKNWRDLDLATISAWISYQGKCAYQPLWQIDINQVLFQRSISQSPKPEREVVGEWLKQCMYASFSLLRPDFDAAGSVPMSYTGAHYLWGNSEWELCALPKNTDMILKWQDTWISDSHLLMCMQMRHCVPLAALVDMKRLGENLYQQMPIEEQIQYQIIQPEAACLDVGRNETIQLQDPDSFRKIYRWQYRPKGGKTEFEQVVRVDFSKERYEYYHGLPRFEGHWNKYAEIEIPEIRQLASEFQRLLEKRNWSTYNQANNVMKFIQTCIPYSSDMDTTGHQDWARYPIETLVEGTGDCEDVAILCASVLARLGFSVILLCYPNHLAFGVAGADELSGDYIVDAKTGRKYFYGEATAKGWHLGQIPPKYRGIEPEDIFPVTLLVAD